MTRCRDVLIVTRWSYVQMLIVITTPGILASPRNWSTQLGGDSSLEVQAARLRLEPTVR